VTSKRLFLDLGAHKGNDTAFYLDKGWRTVTVEAHPELAHECDQRFHLQRFDCRVVHRAISPEGKPTKLYTSGKGAHGETHSTIPDRVKRSEEVAHTVEGTTVGYLLKTFGVPYYMKVDIEGADIVAIRQLHEWHTKRPTKWAPLNALPPLLSVELSQNHPEEALEIFSHLAYMGYDKFSLEEQHWDETVDVDQVQHFMSLSQVAAGWFGNVPRGLKDMWYDLHAMHSTFEEGTI